MVGIDIGRFSFSDLDNESERSLEGMSESGLDRMSILEEVCDGTE